VFSYGVTPPKIHQKRLSSKLCKTNIEKIACGSGHFLLLTDKNVLLVGGNNFYGQCARDPNLIQENEASVNLKVAQVRLENYLITDIAAGSYHSLILAHNDGYNKLLAFGHNLGCGFLDRENRHNPTLVFANELTVQDPAVKVFAGRMRSAVILKSGIIKMWGEWYNGAKQRTLRQLDINTEGDEIEKICMGQFHSLFLSKQGKIYSWGDNTYGELGVSKSTKWLAVPTLIPFFEDKVCIDCDVGGRHSLVLEKNGNLYSFGDNSEGQCGIELSRTYEPQLIETKGMLGEDTIVAISIFAGDAHSALVTSEGDLFAWGDNSEERLGVHTTSSIFRPTLVEDVMGRYLCAVGLGGFFSIFITGPREFSIGRKNIAMQEITKMIKISMFKKKNNENEPAETKNKFSLFSAILANNKNLSEEKKTDENPPEEEKINK
jgi:alpha-tubulin suppressor-like RCC1 family protein